MKIYCPMNKKAAKGIVGATKDQLLLDKAVLRDCKPRSTNLAMASQFVREFFSTLNNCNC